jgi:hypothetical protein
MLAAERRRDAVALEREHQSDMAPNRHHRGRNAAAHLTGLRHSSTLRPNGKSTGVLCIGMCKSKLSPQCPARGPVRAAITSADEARGSGTLAEPCHSQFAGHSETMNKDALSAVIFQYVHRVVELVPETAVGLLDCELGCGESQLAIAEQTLRRSIGHEAELICWPQGKFSVILAGVGFEETIAAAERARDAVAGSGYLRDCEALRIGVSWCVDGADPQALMGGVRDALEGAKQSSTTIVVAASAPINTRRTA